MIDRSSPDSCKDQEHNEGDERNELLIFNDIHRVMMHAAVTHPRREKSVASTEITSEDFSDSSGWWIEIPYDVSDTLGIFSICAEKDVEGALLWDEYRLIMTDDETTISWQRRRIQGDTDTLIEGAANISVKEKIKLLQTVRNSLSTKSEDNK